MAISGKDVQVWMWRAFKFSIRSVYTLVKHHPFVSCPLLFFLVLYICFPSFFWISLYSTAFLVLAVLVARIYLRHRNAQSLGREEKNSDAESARKDGFGKNDATNNRNEKSFSRARSVRRRKPQETSRDGSVHSSEDEKNTVFSSTFDNYVVDKSALTEERPKEIREIKVDSVISPVECSLSKHPSGLRPDLHDTFSDGPQKFGGGSGVGAGDTEIESSEGTDEEDEQEREANNKAVQWTEADQKNLMDLGFSEIERNKRLESLIARRRARKLLSLQVRRSLVNMDSLEHHVPMTSLMIPRSNNPFIASQSAGNFSPMPSSAPSILLPNQNPFDLPYEPQEEKPNLTGGSFQLEFKDMTFSRHESAASFPGEQKEDQQETPWSLESTKKDGVSDSLENSEVKGQLDEKETDKIIEVESCQSPKSKLNTVTADIVVKDEVPDSKQGMDLVSNCREEKGSEVQTKSVVIEDSVDKLSSASSSEDDVPTFRVDKDAVLRSLASPLLRNFSMNGEGRSQMECVRNNYGPSVFDKNNMQEHLDHVERMHHNHHTSMSSIASDLQVEVSEVSSPALTDDSSTSSPCEKFSAHKGDIVNQSTTGNENIRAASSQLPQIDESEAKEVHDSKDIEGNLKDTKQDKMDDSMETEDSDGLESFQADEGEQHGAELRYSGAYPNLSNYQLEHLLPASVPEQFRISASVSSPRSVLQPNISIDPSPLSNFGDNHVEVHQFHPERVENNMLNEARGAGLTYTLPQSTISLMVDYISHPLHEGSAKILEESYYHSTIKEANSTGSVGEEMVHENERRQNKIDYISEGGAERQESTNLSTPTKEAKSFGSVHEDMVHENERRQNETNYIPEGSLERQESSSLSRSAKEDNSTGSVSENMVHKNERRQKTSSIPVGSSERLETSNLSSSAEEDNPMGSVSQKLTHENEIKPNGMEVIPKGSSQELSSLDSAAALSKLQKEMNSDFPDVGQEYSNFLTSAKEANSIGSVNKQVIHEDDKKQNEIKDVPEGSPNSFNYDSKAALSKLAEESNSSLPVLASNEDANLMGTISEQVFPESESRQNETRDISEGRLESSSPESTVTLSKCMGESSSDLTDSAHESSNLSASPEEVKSMKFVDQQIIHKNGEGQNKAKDIPEVGSQGLRSSESSDATAALSKPREEIHSRSLTMTDDRSENLHEHEADNEGLPSSLSLVDQVNKLNAPVINREKISQFQGNRFEATYEEKVSDSVEGEAQASTNATTSKDSQDTLNELQKLGSQEDRTGLLILPETSEVSTDKYPPDLPDEKEGGFNKPPSKGESEISSAKDITEVEPSK